MLVYHLHTHTLKYEVVVERKIQLSSQSCCLTAIRWQSLSQIFTVNWQLSFKTFSLQTTAQDLHYLETFLIYFVTVSFHSPVPIVE